MGVGKGRSREDDKEVIVITEIMAVQATVEVVGSRLASGLAM